MFWVIKLLEFFYVLIKGLCNSEDTLKNTILISYSEVFSDYHNPIILVLAKNIVYLSKFEKSEFLVFLTKDNTYNVDDFNVKLEKLISKLTYIYSSLKAKY